MLTIQERAGRFLHRLADSTQVSAAVSTPPGNSAHLFVRAAAAMVPALILVASAHAGNLNQPTEDGSSAIPHAIMQINGTDTVSLDGVQAMLEKASTFRERDGDSKDVLAGPIAQCLQEHVLKGATRDPALAMAAAFATAKVDAQITAWSQRTGGDPADAVAAFCEHPADWMTQLESWKQQANKYGDSSEGIKQSLRDQAYARLAGRMETITLATEQAAQVQRQTLGMAPIGDDSVGNASPVSSDSMMGAKAIKVGGFNFNWVNAATSIAGGASRVVGSQSDYNSVNRAGNEIRTDTSFARTAQSIANNSNPTSQAQSIGSLLNSVGSHMQSNERQQEAKQRQIQNELTRLHQLREQEAALVQKVMHPGPRDTARQVQAEARQVQSNREQQQRLLQQLASQGVHLEPAVEPASEPQRPRYGY